MLGVNLDEDWLIAPVTGHCHHPFFAGILTPFFVAVGVTDVVPVLSALRFPLSLMPTTCNLAMNQSNEPLIVGILLLSQLGYDSSA
jgi:hypothetical protein